MKSMWKRGMVLGGMVAIGAMSSACGVAIEGEEGNLRFEYDNSAFSGAFSEDLAVGSMIDVKVRETSESEFLPIASATSSSEEVIAVSETSGQVVSLRAESEGVARISVSATAESGSLSDSVELRAAEVDSIEIEAICDESSVYAVNSAPEFRYRMRDAMSNSLNGYGYYPVAVEPETGGEINGAFSSLGRIQVMTGEEAGAISLTSDLLEEPFAMTLVAAADITELDVANQVDGETITTIATGEEAPISIFAMAGPAGETVCGDAEGIIELVSETPEVCEPYYTYGLGVHVVNVQGLSAGACEISVSVPGTDLAETLQVEISGS